MGYDSVQKGRGLPLPLLLDRLLRHLAKPFLQFIFMVVTVSIPAAITERFCSFRKSPPPRPFRAAALLD